MAVYTSITDDELNRFLAGYGLPAAARYEGIPGGIENTNYRVWAGGRRLILTLYEGRTAVSDLPYFLRLMGHVAAAGASAAAPLTDLTGRMLGELAGRPAALVVHLNGSDIEQPTAPHAYEAGRALADFHAATADFDDTRPNGFGPATWIASARNLGPNLDRVAPGAAKTACDRLAALYGAWPADLPTGTIHADFFPDNVLFEAGEVSGIIDLYFACTDALAYDLAVAMASWIPGTDAAPDPTNAVALRAGYESKRRLTDEEAQALPCLIEGAAWRFFLTRAEDWLAPRSSSMGIVKDPLPFWRLARHAKAHPTHLMENR